MIDTKQIIIGMVSAARSLDVSSRSFADPVLIHCTRDSDHIVGVVEGHTLGICRVHFFLEGVFGTARQCCFLLLSTGDLVNECDGQPLPLRVQNMEEIRARFIAEEHIDAVARAMGHLIARRHHEFGLQTPFATLVEQLRLDCVPFVDATAIERRMPMIFTEIMSTLPDSINHRTVLERWVRASMSIDPTRGLDAKRLEALRVTPFSVTKLGCLLTDQKPTEEPMERHEPFDFRLRTNLLTGAVHVRERYIGHIPERDRMELLVAAHRYVESRYEGRDDLVANLKHAISPELGKMVKLSGCDLLDTIEQKQYPDFRAWCRQFLPVLQAAPSTLRHRLYEALAQQSMDKILSAAPASDRLPMLMLVQPWFDVITPLCDKH